MLAARAAVGPLHPATAERVKRILLASMLACGEHGVETPIGRITMQRSSTRAVAAFTEPTPFLQLT